VVEVLGLLPVKDTADVPGTSEATVRFTVQETSGQGVSLDPVSVVRLSHVAKDAIQFQAPFELKDAKPLSLSGGSSQSVLLTLEGLEGAGEYKGTLRLSGAGMQPVDREFRVYLKEHWTVAFLCICLGVIASLALRRWVQHLRPMLEVQQALLLLRRELEHEAQAAQPLDDTERRVLIGIQGELDLLVAQVGAGSVKTADAQAVQTQLRRKRELFPVWLWVRRQVSEVQPASLREPFEQRLDAARALLAQGAVTAEDLARARADVEKIPGELEVAVRQELKKAIDALSGEVEAQREDVHSPLRAKLVAEVAPDVTAARKALERGVADGVKEARALYSRARRTYLDLLASQLVSELSGAPPYGFEPAGWDDLKTQVLAELAPARSLSSDLEVAFAAYERAHRLVLTHTARARRCAARSREAGGGEHQPVARGEGDPQGRAERTDCGPGEGSGARSRGEAPRGRGGLRRRPAQPAAPVPHRAGAQWQGREAPPGHRGHGGARATGGYPRGRSDVLRGAVRARHPREGVPVADGHRCGSLHHVGHHRWAAGSALPLGE
jgi:hypothetical protein